MTSWSQDGPFRALPADADFSVSGTGQYRGVKQTATGFALCGAADAGFLGLLTNDPAQGQVGTIRVRDVGDAVAGAAIAVNAAVTTNAQGRFVTATTGQPVHGRAQTAAAASGDLFSLEVRREGAAV